MDNPTVRAESAQAEQTGPPSENPPLALPIAENLAAALELAELGLSVAALCHPHHANWHPSRHRVECKNAGKQAVHPWKALQRTPLPKEELEKQWKRNEGFNVGVITGRVSGLIRIDIDSDYGRERWEEFCKGVDYPTWQFKTSRGEGLLYGWPKNIPADGDPFRGLVGDLEFKGDGRLTVVPPSLHKDGTRYGYTRGGPRSGLPWREAFTDLLAAVVQASAARRQRLPGGRGGGNSAGPLESADRNIRRARAYLERCEPAVSGDGGHNKAFKVLDHVINGIGVSAALAYMLAQEVWNPRCDPPWSDDDLRRKCEQAASHGRAARKGEGPACRTAGQDRGAAVASRSDKAAGTDEALSLPAPPPPVSGSPEGGPWQEDVSDRRHVAPYGERNTNGPPAPDQGGGFVRLPGDAVPLSAFKGRRPEFLLDGWVHRGHVTEVVGESNGGKSTFLRSLIPLARHTLIFATEDNPEEVWRPVLDRMGISEDRVTYLVGDNWVLPAKADRVIKIIRYTDADLALIDPFEDCMEEGWDDEKFRFVIPYIKCWIRLCAETGIAACGVRHPGKKEDNPIAGSRAWKTRPRVVIQLALDQPDGDMGVIRHLKNQVSKKMPDTAYRLIRQEGLPPLFEMGEPLSREQAEFAGIVTDKMERFKSVLCAQLLQSFLSQGKQPTKAVLPFLQSHGISDSTAYRVAKREGITFDREGSGLETKGWWIPPAHWLRPDDTTVA